MMPEPNFFLTLLLLGNVFADRIARKKLYGDTCAAPLACSLIACRIHAFLYVMHVFSYMQLSLIIIIIVFFLSVISLEE